MKQILNSISIAVCATFLHGCDVGAENVNSTGNSASPQPVVQAEAESLELSSLSIESSIDLKEVSHFNVGNGGALSPQVSNDGKFLFVAEGNQIKTFRLGDNLESVVKLSVKSEKDDQRGIALSPDNKFLYSVTSGAYVNSYKVNSDGSLKYIEHVQAFNSGPHDIGTNTSTAYAAKVSPDGKYLFVSLRNRWVQFKGNPDDYTLVKIYYINDENGKLSPFYPKNGMYNNVKHRINSFATSQNGKLLYSATNDKSMAVAIYRVDENGTVNYVKSISHPDTYSGLSTSLDGSKLYATDTSTHYIITYDILPSGDLKYSRIDDANAKLKGITLDPSGLFLIGSDGKSIRIYRIASENN